MCFVQSPDVAWNFLGETIIAFNLNGEREFHELNASAAVLFHSLEQARSAEELTQVLLAEFAIDPATAASDVAECLNALLEKRLIVSGSASGSFSGPT